MIFVLYVAFHFNHDNGIAPKVGMEVQIIDLGFKKNSNNPSFVDIYNMSWFLVTWWTNQNGLWNALLCGKSRINSVGEPIDMDVAIIVPVCALKYISCSSGYGNVHYKLLAPDNMLKLWKHGKYAQQQSGSSSSSGKGKNLKGKSGKGSKKPSKSKS